MKRTLLALLPMTALAVGTLALNSHVTLANDHPPMDMGPGHPEGPGGPGPHGGPFPMLEGLDLTKKQQAALHDIFKQAHESSHDVHGQGRQIHEQITALLLAPGPVDRAQLNTLVQQEEALHAKQDAERLDVAVKIHDLLTPEQLAQAKSRHDRISSLLDQLHAVDHPDDKH